MGRSLFVSFCAVLPPLFQLSTKYHTKPELSYLVSQNSNHHPKSMTTLRGIRQSRLVMLPFLSTSKSFPSYFFPLLFLPLISLKCVFSSLFPIISPWMAISPSANPHSPITGMLCVPHPHRAKKTVIVVFHETRSGLLNRFHGCTLMLNAGKFLVCGVTKPWLRLAGAEKLAWGPPGPCLPSTCHWMAALVCGGVDYHWWIAAAT